ncbi:hypothetical protein [Leucobacter soli]|uniref:hypothetical protein n=1 Tax=Leucobacter soli TaxID=2812850 RepID=UPI0036141A7B
MAAVANAVRSAFGGPAEARTARVVVLLGNVGRSKRLRRLFADAVRSLRVGDSGADAGSAVEAGSAPAADPLAFDVGPCPHRPEKRVCAHSVHSASSNRARSGWSNPSNSTRRAGCGGRACESACAVTLASGPMPPACR